jgi:hypothetical protein
MPGLIIKKAVYGYGNVAANQNNVVDVTEKVQAIANSQGSTVNIEISPATFGIADPVQGTVKGLTVEYYSQSGPTLLVRGGIDGETVKLVNGHPVQIEKAIYGGTAYGIDITDKLSEYFADPGAPDLQIGDAYFLSNFCGGDPSPGVSKSLSIEMKYLGQTSYMIGYDGKTLKRVNDGNNSIIKIS